MQIGFERLFHARLADQRVHGVALLLVFGVFIRVHGRDIAEDMRSVGGVIFAHRAVFDHNARHGQLHYGGQRFRGDVLGERVVFKANVVDRAQLQLIADGNDAVNVLLAPVVRDLIFAAQALHERRRGDIEVIAPAGKEFAEIALPGRVVRVGIGIGSVRRDREVRFILNAELIAEVQHLQQIPVRVGRVEKDEVDDDEVIARAV